MSRAALPLVVAAILSGCVSSPDRRQTEDPLAAAAEVRRLEDSWTTAFNGRDVQFMEQTIAPEYILVNSGGPRGANVTPREDWMRVWLGPEQVPYEAKVLHVVVAGDTAVATLEARWRRNSYLTDTWVRRDGRWQLIHRHSASR
jgi:ketosteroid isomerase-like protein